MLIYHMHAHLPPLEYVTTRACITCARRVRVRVRVRMSRAHGVTCAQEHGRLAQEGFIGRRRVLPRLYQYR